MSTRSSLLFSFLDRYAGLVVSIVSSMFIARLLTPAEIGLYSVTMVLLTFVSTVRDMGAGTYLVQEKNLTTDRIRAVWAVQLGLGLGLALLVAVASYPVSLFYKEPRMRDIMLIISLSYAFNPFGSLTYAWLMREMRFKNIAMMRLTSTVVGAVVSVWFAWKNYGPISLALGGLMSTIANGLLSISFRPKHFPWRPGVREIKKVLAFGSKLMSGSIFGTLANGAPELLLGKLQSLTSAGFYSRANGLVQMFNRLVTDAVSSVCLPWFSKKSREGGGLAESFLVATSYVTAIGWTFCIAIFCLAHPTIRILYGNQWDSSVEMTRLLAIAIAFSIPAALCNIALLASDGVTKITQLTIFNACQTVACVAIGAFQGFLTLGVFIIISSAVGSIATLIVTIRHIEVPLGLLFKNLYCSLKVVAISAIGPIFAICVFGIQPSSPVISLLTGGAFCMLGFIVGVRIFRHPLNTEINSVLVKINTIYRK